MSHWGSKKARAVLAALLRIGWQVRRQCGGSHRVLGRVGRPDFVFAFHDGEEIGPRMLARQGWQMEPGSQNRFPGCIADATLAS